MRDPDPFARPEILFRRVYAYVAYRLGPGPDAEDVTNDVFERALRYRSSYDRTRSEPVSWLVGIARRCIAESVGDRHAIPSPMVDEKVDPDDLEEQTLRRLRIRAAVAELQPRERELVALRYGADLTAARIGDVLGLEANTVEVALHRTLRRLRASLEEQHGGEVLAHEVLEV
jgi:RNA polymerase sigma-70 factor (ECF subfamily)